MATVLAFYRMQIQPHSGQLPRECLDEICGHFSKIAVKYYRERGREIFPLPFDGRLEQLNQDHWLVSRKQSAGHHTLASVDWQIAASEDRHYAWRISWTCAADRQGLELQYRTELNRGLLTSPRLTSVRPLEL